MTVVEHGEPLLRVKTLPLETSLFIGGPPRSGKTEALLERARRADPATALILPDLVTLASEVYESCGSQAPRLLDPIEAEEMLVEAAAPLYDLSWEEFESAQIDPEVGGVRMRDRFLSAAFVLVCRLRAALVTPGEFLQTAMAGATSFYANPPNLADTALLAHTHDDHRNSLAVTRDELQRQHRREVDLAKILSRIYASYVTASRDRGTGTRHDVIAGAIEHIGRNEGCAERLRARYRTAFIDEAQHLTIAELQLLASIFGPELRGVTLAGDERSCVCPFGGPRAGASAAVAERIELPAPARDPARHVETLRAADARDEAIAIALHVAGLIQTGTPPEEIGVLLRSVRAAAHIEEALLDQDVPVQVAGDNNPFADRRALDATALLWNVHDPFRHDWMLRTLSGPAVGLSDASLATLCNAASDGQDALFALENVAQNPSRPSRWDARRDVRLGWNAIRGAQDAALSADARERLDAFRQRRATWIDAARRLGLSDFAHLVWHSGLAREGAPGSARALSQQIVLRRLTAWFAAFSARRPDATLGDLLEELERRAASDYERTEPSFEKGFVALLSVDAAAGRTFSRAVVANVQAGGFPLYYVPDAFLFSPKMGVVPKDNVGDARSARTAKFTYYMFKAKTRENYNKHERRAFDYALTRGRDGVLVTAAGRPTRGIGTPELLEELHRATG